MEINALHIKLLYLIQMTLIRIHLCEKMRFSTLVFKNKPFFRNYPCNFTTVLQILARFVLHDYELIFLLLSRFCEICG